MASGVESNSGIFLDMDNKLKEVLLKLASEIEDLKAILLAMSAHPSLKMSLVDAQDAKSLAIQAHRGHYAQLRKEIESL